MRPTTTKQPAATGSSLGRRANLEVTHDGRRRSDRHRARGDVAEDYRVRADDGPAADRDARADDDVLAEPHAVLDHHRRDPIDALVENRGVWVVECVRVIGDVDPPGEQNPLADRDRRRSGEDTVADDPSPGPDRDGEVVARTEHLEPAPRPDRDEITDRDPALATEPERRLYDRVLPEGVECARARERERLGPSADDKAVRAEEMPAKKPADVWHERIIRRVSRCPG